MRQNIHYYMRYDKAYKRLTRKKKNIPAYLAAMEKEARNLITKGNRVEQSQGYGQLAAVTDYKMCHSLGEYGTNKKNKSI